MNSEENDFSNGESGEISYNPRLSIESGNNELDFSSLSEDESSDSLGSLGYSSTSTSDPENYEDPSIVKTLSKKDSSDRVSRSRRRSIDDDKRSDDGNKEKDDGDEEESEDDDDDDFSSETSDSEAESSSSDDFSEENDEEQDSNVLSIVKNCFLEKKRVPAKTFIRFRKIFKVAFENIDEEDFRTLFPLMRTSIEELPILKNFPEHFEQKLFLNLNSTRIPIPYLYNMKSFPQSYILTVIIKSILDSSEKYSHLFYFPEQQLKFFRLDKSIVVKTGNKMTRVTHMMESKLDILILDELTANLYYKTKTKNNLHLRHTHNTTNNIGGGGGERTFNTSSMIDPFSSKFVPFVIGFLIKRGKRFEVFDDNEEEINQKKKYSSSSSSSSFDSLIPVPVKLHLIAMKENFGKKDCYLIVTDVLSYEVYKVEGSVREGYKMTILFQNKEITTMKKKRNHSSTSPLFLHRSSSSSSKIPATKTTRKRVYSLPVIKLKTREKNVRHCFSRGSSFNGFMDFFKKILDKYARKSSPLTTSLYLKEKVHKLEKKLDREIKNRKLTIGKKRRQSPKFVPMMGGNTSSKSSATTKRNEETKEEKE